MADDSHAHKPAELWRAARRFFQSGGLWKSGQVCFSPAWFAQGQTVCCTRCVFAVHKSF